MIKGRGYFCVNPVKAGRYSEMVVVVVAAVCSPPKMKLVCTNAMCASLLLFHVLKCGKIAIRLCLLLLSRRIC